MSPRKGTFIDGYSSVQAIRRTDPSAPRPAAPAKPSAPAAPPPAAANEPADAAASQVHFEHTIVPPKHDLVCYECGYAFTITGKIHYPLCPKCKRMYNVNHEVIEGDWTTDLRTMTSIEIRPGATVRGALLVAQTIIIAGDVREANIQASRRLELADGAIFDPATLKYVDLVIRPGARIRLPLPISCRTLDVGGALEASVQASDLITVRAGGEFRGVLHAPRLQMEDGAGLSARVYLGPGAQAAAKHAA